MKKIAYAVAITVFVTTVIACGSKTEKKSTEEFVANDAPAEKTAAADPIAEGETLVKSNDCKTCHHKTNKLIGPAHLDVAKKYDFTEANVKMLAGKIIKGGQGVWGDIPMSAHSGLSEADAEKMAKYVLSLDGEKEH